MQTSQHIHVLSDETVRKIAAGEVIERPHSIAKELMENAVDAFATKITVRFSQGGKDEITVIDNGIGFHPDDLPLSVVKNATSKITTDDDLNNITSHGFRGEALSSISSVSRFCIVTKHQNAQEGLALSVEGANDPVIKPAAAHQGTQIRVKDLFFNVPARRKFLKTSATESSHIEKTWKKIALAHPEIHMVLEKDGNTVWDLPRVETLHQRIGQLYPAEIADHMMSFSEEKGPIKVYGFGSNQKNTLSRSSEIWIFVNGRSIQDRMLMKAVLEGYRSTMLENKYPYVFLFLDMPPSYYDVNVHPTKSEIRFQDTQILFQMTKQAIAQALPQRLAHHSLIHPTRHHSSVPSKQELAKVQQPARSSSLPWYKPADEEPARSMAEQPFAQEKQSDLGFFGQLSILGVLDGTYIICKNKEAIVLIDQHAAHERVLYEQLTTQYKSKKHLSQRQLIPVTISCSPDQIETLETINETLKHLGIEWDHFGDEDILIRSIPSTLDASRAKALVEHLIDEVQAGEMPTAHDDITLHMLSTIACHSAVRAHDRLEQAEIQNLLQDMDTLDLASYCPHGRPTFLTLETHDLERLFQRKV